MNFENSKASYTLARAIMLQLVRSGVKRLVVSPGFRNSTLILAGHKTPELEVVTIVDERGAAFFALGASKIDGKPTALICTSGTATANYFPAVMEAFHAHVPIVLITADRPEELIGTGSNQTTNQENLYPKHTRASFLIPPPFEGFNFVANASQIIGKAVVASLSPAAGPVHVNVRFREPFLPDEKTVSEVESEMSSPEIHSTILPSASGPSLEHAQAIEKLFANSQRTIFCIGPGGHSSKRLAAIAKVARELAIPIIAEPSSGISFLGEELPLVHRADQTWNALFNGKLKSPELVVRFGAPLLSKNFSSFLKKQKPIQLIFEEWGENREPENYPSIFIQGGMEGWLESMTRWSSAAGTEKSWCADLTHFDSRCEEKISTIIHSESSLTEWGFHAFLGKFIGDEANLFLGNSMPIRDFDMVFPRLQKKISLFSNRGQSGIDGLLASAVGVSHSSSKETHAILGDLSTIHDLSSMALVSRLQSKMNFTIWILNNGGGEIFRIVPTAKAGAKEEWFTTPEQIDFSAVAKAFRIPFIRVAKLEDLKSLEPSLREPRGARIIEVLVDPVQNLEIRNRGREIL